MEFFIQEIPRKKNREKCRLQCKLINHDVILVWLLNWFQYSPLKTVDLGVIKMANKLNFKEIYDPGKFGVLFLTERWRQTVLEVISLTDRGGFIVVWSWYVISLRVKPLDGTVMQSVQSLLWLSLETKCK